MCRLVCFENRYPSHILLKCCGKVNNFDYFYQILVILYRSLAILHFCINSVHFLMLDISYQKNPKYFLNKLGFFTKC